MIKLFRLLKPFRIPIIFVFVLVFLQSPCESLSAHLDGGYRE